MKAVEATVTLMALAALAPVTAFAPSAATGTAIRRSRGEYVPVGSELRELVETECILCTEM